MDYSEDSEIPGSSCQNNQNEESGRGCRNRKKQNEQTSCPVCSVTLRQNEVDMHLHSEIEKLNKLPASKHKLNGKCNPSSSSCSDSNPDKNWETFQKVRSNRQTRQRTKTRKRRPEDACPICNKEVTEDLSTHVEKCLRRSEANGSSSDENIDVEAFEVEEYEWAGQSRVRATSLLQGGVSNLGTTITMADEDEDLNVDGDDTQMYGSPQYSENDVILPCEDPAPEDVALRKAVIGSDPKRLCTEKDKNSEANASEDPVVEVLKNRIRELESKEQNREIYKCLICMERYHTPVISVCCWHVHCEECWLQTLGAKKLCPQCNMITSPADLRRIYM